MRLFFGMSNAAQMNVLVKQDCFFLKCVGIGLRGFFIFIPCWDRNESIVSAAHFRWIIWESPYCCKHICALVKLCRRIKCWDFGGILDKLFPSLVMRSCVSAGGWTCSKKQSLHFLVMPRASQQRLTHLDLCIKLPAHP